MRVKKVIIYREELGVPSEVFIGHQAAALRCYKAHIVCLRGSGALFEPAPVHHILGEDVGRFAVALRRTRKHLPARTISALRDWEPQLVHSHFGVDSIIGLKLSESLGVPLVATFHGYDALKSDASLRQQGLACAVYVRRRKELVQRCSRFVAVSNFVADALIARGFPAAKIVQHYIGVDTDFFQPRELDSPFEPIVLFVGRLVPSKGADYLIKAMALVQSHYPSARLVVIGAGPEEARLRRLADGTLRGTTFLGACEPERVRTWLGRSAVVSVPSVPMGDGYAEALGLVQLEAQAAGVPVVSFRTGGIPEAVAHGETGFLSQPRDWVGLAGHIEALLGNEDLRRRCSEAGRRRACSLFNLRQQTATLEEIYDESVSAAREYGGR